MKNYFFFFRCGKCKRYMKLIETKPERLVCAICNDTYNLPANGNIKTYKEVQCPLDYFDLLYYSGAKSFIFCPNCYNDPPFEDMNKLSGCFKCSNEFCDYSMIRNTFGSCYACNFNGLLTLDRGSAPNWKIICTNCPFSMSLFKSATKVTIDKEQCSVCQYNYIKIKYQDNKTGFGKDPNDFIGCIWCSPEMATVADAIRNYSKSFNQSHNNYNSGRGGGRGGHGRGRGRGRGGRGRGAANVGGRGRSRGQTSAGRGNFNYR